MQRGPKPKPAELKKRLGNPGRRPLETDAPPEAAPAEAPGAALPLAEVSARVPEGLTERAGRFWHEYSAHLRHLSWIKASDMQGLKRLCEWAAIWWDAAQDVAEKGSHYETTGTNGQLLLRLNPSFNVMRVAEDRCEDLEDRYGLNPAARQRIAAQLAAGAAPRQTGLPGMADGEDASRAPAGMQEGDAGRGTALGVLNRGRALH